MSDLAQPRLQVGRNLEITMSPLDLAEYVEHLFADHNEEAIAILASVGSFLLFGLAFTLVRWSSARDKFSAGHDARSDGQVDRLIGIAENAITSFTGNISELLGKLVEVETSNSTRLKSIEGDVQDLPKALAEAVLPELERLVELIKETEERIIAQIRLSARPLGRPMEDDESSPEVPKEATTNE